MKRTFIALKVEPDAALKQQIQQLKNSLAHEKIYWLREQDLHVTLYFVGQTTDEQEQLLQDLLQRFSASVKPFAIHLSAFGLFKRKGKAKILYVDVEESKELIDLVDALWRELKGLGFETGAFHYKAHATVARIRNLKHAAEFEQLIAGVRLESKQQVRVADLLLYESLLSPQGSVYEPIRRFTFRGR